MNKTKDFKNNELYFLVDDDGCETECYPNIFNDGDKEYGYFQMMEGNFNECFLVSIFEIDGVKKMKLVTGEEFKILERIYIYSSSTADYYPIDIDENTFARGYYITEKKA